jgi:hypothetical protein
MKLWDYQKEAIDFIRERKRVYLALDMGLGKTLTSLAAGVELSRKHILVIAEKNEIVNSQNFKREVEAHFPGWEYTSLRDGHIPPPPAGGGDQRYVCGINPDGLKKHDIRALQACFDFCIVDEATMAKNTSTARFKGIRKVCDAMEYLVLLSGTPMMNGAAELYAPLLLLNHPLAGDGSAKAREAFETVFAGGHRRKIKNTGMYWLDYAWWAKGANNVRELRWMIRGNFFFKSKEGSGLFKKKVRTVSYVPMGMEWLAEYTRAWDEYLVEAGKRDVDMDNVMELQRLIENGQLYQVNSKWKAREAVSDIALGRYGDRRVIVFTMYDETYEAIKRHLEAARVSYRTFEDISEWKAGKEQVLLGRLKAHGKGGNAAEASAVLMVDMDFVPANNLQAENRIDRPQQQRDMLIVYYITEGDDVIDAHVRNINQDKSRKIEEFMRPFDSTEEAEMPVRVNALMHKFPRPFKNLLSPSRVV